MKENKDYKTFVKWANRIGKAKLVSCSSGNLSHKKNENTILVSESRQWLESLKSKNIVETDHTGTVINGKIPTGELPLHLAVYKSIMDVNTILHCHSPAATALACSQITDLNYNVLIEVPIYIGNVIHLPYIMPGSENLGMAVAEAARSASVIQLQNHGQVILGNSYKAVFQKAMFFELACEIILRNKFQVSYLSNESCQQLERYRK